MNSFNKYGIFDSATDVGNVQLKGCTHYDPANEVYQLTGSGTNMWFDEDEFHFIWKKVSADFILDTELEWIGEGVDPHRKGGIIIRENFNTGSRYVSAAFHGNGLMSMQYRLVPDSATLEQSAGIDPLPVLRLEKEGKTFRMMASKRGALLKQIGEIEVPFDSTELYVGLFICSHNPEVMEEARFINTRLYFPAKKDFVPYHDYIGCRLETLDIDSGMRKVIYESSTPFEAPNWSPNGTFMVVNSQGKLYRIPAAGGKLKEIDTQFAIANNNDHGFSPDGKQLAISHHASDRPSGENSVIYTVSVKGGKPKQITENSPSYWHGWSPDGKYLIYTAHRKDQWDLYQIPAVGGEEIQLTDNKFLDDGSEYASDGQSIWFNSNRTGSMEIWQMKTDGTGQTQITNDEFQNWFPHQSPDGKWLIFLSYPSSVDLWDHPYYQHVMLRLMNLETGDIRVVANLYGGQGTINVPSWSPDSKKVAFVSNSDLIE